MADTFNNDLRVREQEAGSNSGTWGGLLNTTISNLASAFGQGSEAIPNASTHTITLADGTADEARSMYLKCTGGGQACTVTLAPNTISKVWIISNETSYTLTFSQGSGANVAVAAGAVKMIVTDGAGSGAAVTDALSGLSANVSDVTTTGNISFGDNDKAIFGAGSDLSIYSDGTQSFIQEDGPGALYIQGTHLNLNNAAGNASYITAVDGGAVTLFSGGSAKLATTSTGIDVTGTVTADGITNAGDITLGAGDKLQYNSDRYFTPENNVDGAEISANGVFRVKTGATPAARLLVGGNGDISFYNSDGTSQSLFWDASAESLGIGTSSPDALMRVNGTAKIGEGAASNTAKLMVNTASGAAAGIQLFQDGTESWIIQNPASTTALTFDNSGTERMRIDGSGNVSIGTNSAYGTNKLSVNGGVAIDGRNASTPGLCEKGDTDTGIFWPAANSLAVSTGAAERMRIDSSGNVKIADGNLEFTAVQYNPTIYVPDAAANTYNVGNRGNITIQASNSTSGSQAMSGGRVLINAGNSNNGQTGDIVLSTGVNLLNSADKGTIRFNIGGTASSDEAARLDASGNLLVGTTSSTAPHTLTSGSGGAMWNSTFYISIARTSDSLFLNRIGSDGGVARFYRDGGTDVGSISVTSSATTYNTSSDQRLKDNIADAPSASEDIDAIQVRSFDWKADGTHQKYGMVAQELQNVAPEAVTGDAESDEMMGVDYSKLVPMLVKEIQSLRARVQQLEND